MRVPSDTNFCGMTSAELKKARQEKIQKAHLLGRLLFNQLSTAFLRM